MGSPNTEMQLQWLAVQYCTRKCLTEPMRMAKADLSKEEGGVAEDS